MISFLGAFSIILSMISQVLSGRSGSQVTSRLADEGSCSACAMRSAARYSGTAVSSARTPISEGPAGKSISTLFLSIILAPVTNTFPGPTIFCTGSMLSVPRAMAAMAWAPPVL